MTANKEIDHLKEVLEDLKKKGNLFVAILYGSYAKGSPHTRSDIDLAIYLNVKDKNKETEIIDEIFMSVDREVYILRLDDEDESPFIIQEALKGIHLIEPDTEILYTVSHRVLHETESVRFRKEAAIG